MAFKIKRFIPASPLTMKHLGLKLTWVDIPKDAEEKGARLPS